MLPPINPDLPTVVVGVGHPDDDLITGRGTITRMRWLGHHVVVVPFTCGVNSAVRTELHMRPSQFTDARWREMSAACGHLGAAVVRCPFAVAEDGALTANRAAHIWDWIAWLWPTAWYKAPTYLAGGHPDHQAVGAGARQLQQNGMLPDVRFMVEPEREDTWAGKYPGVPLLTDAAPGEALDALEAAREEYRLIDLAQNRHGIGWRSVPKLIDLALARPWTKYHRPT